MAFFGTRDLLKIGKSQVLFWFLMQNIARNARFYKPTVLILGAVES